MHINILTREIETDEWKQLKDEAWAGVDRGAFVLIDNGIIPKYAFGDFDSVTKDELKAIQETLDVDIVPEKKDFSDFELALKSLIKLGYTSIDVYGALGGRLDHELLNVQALIHPEFIGTDIRLKDKRNTISAINAGEHQIRHEQGKQYVSFIPMIQNTILTLRDLKYELEDEALTIGRSLTLSNEFLSKNAYIKTNQPIVMILSKDYY